MYFKITRSIPFLLLFGFCQSVHGRLLATPDQILQSQYPGHKVEIKNVLLSTDEYVEAKKQAQRHFKDRLFRFYVVRNAKGQFAAAAGLLTRRVRTKDETALYVVSREGKLRYVEIVAFYEPPEYMPKKKWLSEFKAKSIQSAIKIKNDIPKISGATLTAQAISDSARIVLSVWELKKTEIVKGL